MSEPHRLSLTAVSCGLVQNSPASPTNGPKSGSHVREAGSTLQMETRLRLWCFSFCGAEVGGRVGKHLSLERNDRNNNNRKARRVDAFAFVSVLPSVTL